MPHADPSVRPGAATAAVAEQFVAHNPQGQAVMVRKRAANTHEDSIGGLHFGGGAANYELKDGSPVVRIDESTFRVVHTGELLRREEGTHGGTHPAAPARAGRG